MSTIEQRIIALREVADVASGVSSATDSALVHRLAEAVEVTAAILRETIEEARQVTQRPTEHCDACGVPCGGFGGVGHPVTRVPI